MNARGQLAQGALLNTSVFFESEFFTDYNDCRELAEKALQEHGPTPRIVWGYLRYHIYECRFNHHSHTRAPNPENISKVIKAAFTMLSYLDNRKLARALTRLTCLAAATLHLETKPCSQTLERVHTWLDTYEALLPRSSEEYERWCSEMFYSQARVRCKAWEIAQKNPRNAETDFAFISDCVYPSDLEWATDPIVVLDDFQSWARQEIVERNAARTSIFCTDSSTNPLHSIGPNLTTVEEGRALASQLLL